MVENKKAVCHGQGCHLGIDVSGHTLARGKTWHRAGVPVVCFFTSMNIFLLLHYC